MKPKEKARKNKGRSRQKEKTLAERSGLLGCLEGWKAEAFQWLVVSMEVEVSS